jgi:XTP/dITP diphosphohydrolase
MPGSPLRFLSANEFKIAEATKILAPCGIEIVPIAHKIEELQTTDTERLVRDKALKAFGYTGRPLFVEHTGLYLDHLNGFPGGLTQVFWDSLGPERFAELFGTTSNTKVIAKTMVGYVDGQRIHLFEGSIAGQIADAPRGNRDFQWDCVFIPDGSAKTFSELGAKKNEMSMRRKALDALADFLKEHGVAPCKH